MWDILLVSGIGVPRMLGEERKEYQEVTGESQTAKERWEPSNIKNNNNNNNNNPNRAAVWGYLLHEEIVWNLLIFLLYQDHM